MFFIKSFTWFKMYEIPYCFTLSFFLFLFLLELAVYICQPYIIQAMFLLWPAYCMSSEEVLLVYQLINSWISG